MFIVRNFAKFNRHFSFLNFSISNLLIRRWIIVDREMYYDRHNNVTVAQRNFVCAKIKISIKTFFAPEIFLFFVVF